MSYQLQGCCFNLPRWEFSDQPLNPSKLAYGMLDKSLACVSIGQRSDDPFYAVGLSDSAEDSGKHSASAAFFYYCESNSINNGLALIDLGGGRMWLGGVVNGRPWPSSDIIFQTQDIDYHMSLFFDLIAIDDTVALLTSQQRSKEILQSLGRQPQTYDLREIELKQFILLMSPDQRSLICPIKKRVFNLKRLVWIAILLSIFYWGNDLLFPHLIEAPISNIHWNKLNNKTQQQQNQKQQQIDIKKVLESLLKQELAGLARRSYQSNLAQDYLSLLHQVMSEQRVYIDGWDLKLASYSYAATKLNKDNQYGVISLDYQRIAMGQVQEFIDYAMANQLKYQVDLQGNIARVEFRLDLISNTRTNSHSMDLDKGEPDVSYLVSIKPELQDSLQQFNSGGRNFFKVLSRIQRFCYAWQSQISCDIKKPKLVKRSNQINYTAFDQAYPSNEKSPLLVYKLLVVQLKGQAFNHLLSVVESLLYGSSLILVRDLNYNYESKDWQLTLETHTRVIRNLAQQTIRDTQ